MTSQEKIKWLKRYLPYEKQIQFLCEERAKWETIAKKITPTLSDMPKSHGVNDKISSAVEKMMEYEDKINEVIDAGINIKIEIMAAIKSITDPALQNILMLRYVNDKKWEQIAVLTNYNYRYVLKLHGKALNHLHIDKEGTKRHYIM